MGDNVASPFTGDEIEEVTDEDTSRYHWGNRLYRGGAPSPSPESP
jgi:hypothetical protein